MTPLRNKFINPATNISWFTVTNRFTLTIQYLVESRTRTRVDRRVNQIRQPILNEIQTQTKRSILKVIRKAYESILR